MNSELEEQPFKKVYSAPDVNERREIEAIRRQYDVTDATAKFNRIKALDAKVKNPPKITFAILLTVGILTFGAGLALVLTFHQIVWGAILSIVGLAISCVAYPIYKFIFKKRKQKYAPEIIKLSDELL